jgi:hypothetical protein
MKRTLALIVFLLVSCMAYDAPAADICSDTVGWEYVCHDTKECRAYLSGYAAMMKERFYSQKDGWFVENGDTQTIHMNLFYDHLSIYIMGKMVGTRHNDRVWIDVTTWACDIELNLTEKPATLGDWAKWRIPDPIP